LTFPPSNATFQFFLRRLQEIAPIPVTGTGYRLIHASLAEAIGETGKSFEIGGRYNVRGLFGGLYLSESPDLAWGEVSRRYGRSDIIPPLVLGTFELVVRRALDLTLDASRLFLQTRLEDISDPTSHYVSQLIGQAAWYHRFEAIRFPSAVDPGRANIVIFMDQLEVGSRVHRIKTEPYRAER
jgi:RES domain-containing protein